MADPVTATMTTLAVLELASQAFMGVIREAQIAIAKGEAIEGAAIVTRMAERFAEAKRDPGLPPEVRTP